MRIKPFVMMTSSVLVLSLPGCDDPDDVRPIPPGDAAPASSDAAASTDGKREAGSNTSGDSDGGSADASEPNDVSTDASLPNDVSTDAQNDDANTAD